MWNYKDVGESLREVLAALVALSVAALLVAMRQVIRERLARILSKLLSSRHQLSYRDVRQNRWVLNALVELRVLTGGDRVFVAQFHNGTAFVANNPVWRITRTHEVVRPGFAFIACHRRAVQVTQWLDIVSPLFGEQVDGVTQLCEADDTCDAAVFLLEIEKLPDTHGKQAIRMAGTVVGLMAPLYCKNNVIGYVGVEFCGATAGNTIPAATALQMARSVKIINYLLLRAKELQ